MIADERARSKLRDIFIAAAVLICAIQLLALGIHRFVEPLPPDFFGSAFATSGQLEGYAQNPNAFAFQLLMALALLIGSRPQLPALRIPSARAIGSAAILLATMVATRSRAGILCALGALALAAVLHAVPPRALFAQRTLVMVFIAAAAVVGLSIVFWPTVDHALVMAFGPDWRPLAEESDALHWQSTVLGWQAWLRHPVLGGGLGSFMLERESAGLPIHLIHNVPIWFLAEMGLPGLAAYLFFVGSLVWAGASALLREAPHARGMLVAVAVFVVMSTVHDLFFQRTFWFVAGLLVVELGTFARSRTVASEGSR